MANQGPVVGVLGFKGGPEDHLHVGKPPPKSPSKQVCPDLLDSIRQGVRNGTYNPDGKKMGIAAERMIDDLEERVATGR